MDIHSLRREGFSFRAIAKKLGIHRDTVQRHLEANTLPQYHTEKNRTSILDPFWQIIDDYLRQDNYRATWIFDRLKQMNYTGSYETVRDHVRTIKDQRSRLAYSRFETEPGKRAQVDFGDYQIQEPDGSSSTVHAFSMVLGFSRANYVEYVRQCTLESFLDCHINAFRYLGGVPAEILYDNTKNVALGRREGKMNMNNEFLHFVHHYGFTAKVCPPYSPWVKGKVERPMDSIRERFWRGCIFTSLAGLNRDVRFWLDETANRRIHGTHRQPVIERWQQEIPLLGKVAPVEGPQHNQNCKHRPGRENTGSTNRIDKLIRTDVNKTAFLFSF